MKDKSIWIILGLVILVGVLYFTGTFSKMTFIISGTETMTRTAPVQVNPSSTFTLTYTAIGTSGTFGASIQDSVSGGCLFPSGSSSYKTVMLSEDGNTKTISITAPASGSCTFTGDYQFGNTSIKNLNSLTVNICTPTCTRPSDLCLTTSSNGCGGTCTWTITRLNSQDINCDNKISRTELGSAITGWTSGTVSRADLGTSIQSWASS